MTTKEEGVRQPLVLDLRALEHNLDALQSRYRSAKPFPHIVLDDFLEPDVVRLAMDEFPPLDPGEWNIYSHANERKFSHTEPATWPPTLQAVLAELNSQPVVDFLSKLTGIEGLFADDTLEGGGLHQSTTGGFLNIHADFTVHPHHRTWRRRVNLLLYLNRDWPPEYGGDLELWSTDMKRCVESVSPIANRAVIFTTDMDSFHGHPEPMRCPPDVARQSLALYYFTDEADARGSIHRVPGPSRRRPARCRHLRRQAAPAGLRLDEAAPRDLRRDGQEVPPAGGGSPAEASQRLTASILDGPRADSPRSP